MLYKTVLHGSCFGQEIDNILYYRTGLGVDISGLTLSGAGEVNNLVKLHVWPAIKTLLSSNYTLNEIVTYVINENSFDFVYQNPQSLPVVEAATGGEATDGIAPCLICKLNLEPTTVFANGVAAPKRGYLAFGPVASTWIDSDGHIHGDYYTATNGELVNVATAVSQNLVSVIPPALFFPVRVHQAKVAGIFKIQSYADIDRAEFRRLASFRRSRQPEI
jgi:hypothetical protein